MGAHCMRVLERAVRNREEKDSLRCCDCCSRRFAEALKWRGKLSLVLGDQGDLRTEEGMRGEGRLVVISRMHLRREAAIV